MSKWYLYFFLIKKKSREEVVETSVSQSPVGGRGHAALRSPDSQTGVSGSNPLNAGECDADGSWSPQQPSFS